MFIKKKVKTTEGEIAGETIRDLVQIVDENWEGVIKELKHEYGGKFKLESEHQAKLHLINAVLALELLSLKDLFKKDQVEGLNRLVLRYIDQVENEMINATNKIAKYNQGLKLPDFEDVYDEDNPEGLFESVAKHLDQIDKEENRMLDASSEIKKYQKVYEEKPNDLDGKSEVLLLLAQNWLGENIKNFKSSEKATGYINGKLLISLGFLITKLGGSFRKLNEGIQKGELEIVKTNL